MRFWRPMRSDDMSAIADVIRIAHPGYFEDTAIFLERLALYPNGCKAVEDQGVVLGYGVAHPSRLGRPPLLNSYLERLPDDANCLHVHDVALLPEGRGGGLPVQFIDELRRQAQASGLSHLALIAVAGKEEYWRKQGFALYDGDQELLRRLSSYGADSVYMTAVL